MAGQELLLCGYAGLEGTLRILDESEEDLGTRFVPAFLEKAKLLREKLVLPDQILSVKEQVSDIRQIGSGGILAALWELGEELQTGFDIDFSKIALKQETVEICEFYQLNPYLMTSAGSFLLVTGQSEEVIACLAEQGVSAVRLGCMKDQNARVIKMEKKPGIWTDRQRMNWQGGGKNMLNIVLFEPEIPANTGNIGRTCVATGTRLHLIEPLGFRINEKSLKRAGMDYWKDLDVTTYIDYQDFLG